jgi:predicted nucleic acid-binding protein
MIGDRFLVDTSYVAALLNRHDQYHDQAKAILPRLKSASEVLVTEAVLIEIGDFLCKNNRSGAVEFIRECYQTRNCIIVKTDESLIGRALTLYADRHDKEWGLTDCISFVVMKEQAVIDALTSDKHFQQAGYRALLLTVN